MIVAAIIIALAVMVSSNNQAVSEFAMKVIAIALVGGIVAGIVLVGVILLA